jgi:hypothetical protein
MIFYTEERIKEYARKAGTKKRFRLLYPTAARQWSRLGNKIKELFPE